MNARTDAGYSLVELLVVLALIGFIAVAIAGGVRFGSRAWEKSGADVDTIERMNGAQNLLRALLQRIIPRDIDPNAPGDESLFAGARDTLAFTAASPSAFNANGLARFELSVTRAGNVQSLELSWQSANAAPTHQILVTGARDIAFSYAVKDKSGGLSWTDSWSGQSGAPALVMIRATYPDGAGRRWPELIVRPRISRDATCVYDPVSFSCRHG
jgi:general secretion pathway protein J